MVVAEEAEEVSARFGPHAAKRQAACAAMVPSSGVAMAQRPRHFGSARSRIDCGRSFAETRSVLTISTRARGGAAMPKPLRRAVHRGEIVGHRRPVGFQKPFPLQPQRAQRFVAPEDVAAGPVSLGQNRLRQTAASSRVRLVLRPHGDVRFQQEVLVDRIAQFRVHGRIGHDHPLGGRPASDDRQASEQDAEQYPFHVLQEPSYNGDSQRLESNPLEGNVQCCGRSR